MYYLQKTDLSGGDNREIKETLHPLQRIILTHNFCLFFPGTQSFRVYKNLKMFVETSFVERTKCIEFTEVYTWVHRCKMVLRIM